LYYSLNSEPPELKNIIINTIFDGEHDAILFNHIFSCPDIFFNYRKQLFYVPNAIFGHITEIEK